MSDLANHVDLALARKLDALAAAAALSEWRFAINPGPDAERPAYDDSRWSTVTLPHNWSSLDGEAWFRTVLLLPEQAEGIPVQGAGLELDIWLTIGATVYVDGVPRFAEPSWTDSRPVPLLLTEAVEAGRPIHLAVRCHAGDGFGVFIQARPRVSSLAQQAFALDTMRGQIGFTRFLAEAAGDAEHDRLLETWHAGAALLDLPALADNRWEAWSASVERARLVLAPFAALAKQYTAHVVGHSHIDMNWLWPMQETVDVCRRDFAAADQLMARYPDFVFSQSQAAAYRMIEGAHPDLFAAIQRRVAEGRWEVTASTWVEGDQNLACGEALVRQLLYARRYTREKFGVEPLICWEPDTFGHPATLPQLLAQCGIRYYYFCRAGRRHPIFWWEGLDGSRVLAVQDPRWYMGDVLPADVAGSVVDFARAGHAPRGIFVYGVGDHGGGGTARDVEAALAIDATPLLPRTIMGPVSAYFAAAEREVQELPVVRGELNPVFEGCYTTHGDIKRLNRDLENLLLSAESAAVVAGIDDADATLAEAWRTLCFHQFHDILCGCAIGVTYREAAATMGAAFRAVEAISGRALAELAQATDTQAGRDDGLRLVVFNPLPWLRDDVVSLPETAWNGATPAWLVDDGGGWAPVQVVGDRLVFVATGVPALGTRVYRAAGAAEAPPAANPGYAVTTDPAGLRMTNGLLRLHVHPASGALDELVDLTTGRNLAGMAATGGVEARAIAGLINRFQIAWEQPHPMSAWHIGDITRVDNLIAGADVRVVESGPVCGVVEVRHGFLHSSLIQRITLYRGLPRVDFVTAVDWHERGSAHADAPMLRVAFTPQLGETDATFEVPFAGLQRPADGREVPALRWADISEREGRSANEMAPAGLALLNDGKYGHQAQGNTLSLTLVRAAYEPDVNPDEGLQHFTYSLYPHADGWRAAAVERQGAALNQPLRVHVTDAHRGERPPGAPWLHCDAGNVMISAVKRAEDQPGPGRSIVVRLFEAHGQAGRATLHFGAPIERAESANPIEDAAGELACEANAITLSLAPHAIRTVRVTLAA